MTIIKSDIIYDPSTKDEEKNSWEYYVALDSQDYVDRSYTKKKTNINNVLHIIQNPSNLRKEYHRITKRTTTKKKLHRIRFHVYERY